MRSIREIREIAFLFLGKRVIVILKSGVRVRGVIVSVGLFSLVLRVRVGKKFVRRTIRFRNILAIIPRRRHF